MATAAWAAWLLILTCFGAWTPRQILVAAATDANDGRRYTENLALFLIAFLPSLFSFSCFLVAALLPSMVALDLAGSAAPDFALRRPRVSGFSLVAALVVLSLNACVESTICIAAPRFGILWRLILLCKFHPII